MPKDQKGEGLVEGDSTTDGRSNFTEKKLKEIKLKIIIIIIIKLPAWMRVQ